MLEPILELTSSTAWNIAFKQNLEATLEVPIKKQNFLCPSNLLLIGCVSNLAKPNWWLGCWLSVSLSLGSVDSASAFSGITQILSSRIGLRQFTLLHWRAYQPTPYIVTLSIPNYLKHLYVEAYWYDGNDSDSHLEMLKGIDARTINIEREINLINNNGTDSTADSGNDGTGGI